MFLLGLIVGLIAGGAIFWFFNDQIRVAVAKAFNTEAQTQARLQGLIQTLKASQAAKANDKANTPPPPPPPAKTPVL